MKIICSFFLLLICFHGDLLVAQGLCENYCLIPEYHKIEKVFITEKPAIKVMNSSPDYVYEFLNSIWTAGGATPPKTYLTATDKGFSKIKSLVLRKKPTMSESKFNKLVEHVKVGNAKDIIVWQRDLFKIFNKNGKPEMTYFNTNDLAKEHAMGTSRNHFNAIHSKFSQKEKEIKEVGLIQLEKQAQGVGFKGNSEITGFLGGNVEPFIEESYMVGDRGMHHEEWLRFTKSLCGEKGRAIKIDTDWLHVGHVDEIIKVIRPKNNKSCNWTVLYPDTNLAFNLLSKNKGLDFVNPPAKILTECSSSLEDCRKSIDLNLICGAMNYLNSKNFASSPIDKQYDKAGISTCFEAKNNGLESVKNFTRFKKYNSIIQKRIDDIVAKLKSHSRRTQPNCGEVDFLPIPILYVNDKLINEDLKTFSESSGVERIKKIQSQIQDLNDFNISSYKASNLFPNLINGLQIKNSLILPSAYNNLFQDYITNELKKRGFKTLYIDTFHFGHVGRGDIHCTTNSETSCALKNAK